MRTADHQPKCGISHTTHWGAYSFGQKRAGSTGEARPAHPSAIETR
jgi:hypothetical protein